MLLKEHKANVPAKHVCNKGELKCKRETPKQYLYFYDDFEIHVNDLYAVQQKKIHFACSYTAKLM